MYPSTLAATDILLSNLGRDILRNILYFDIFDHPLSKEEIIKKKENRLIIYLEK